MKAFKLRPYPGRILKFFLPIVSVSIATFSFVWSGLPLRTHSLFLLISAVVISSLYGGLGSGIFAALLAALSQDYFFQNPTKTLGVASAADALELAMFMAVALLLNYLGSSIREAQHKAEEASAAREDILAVVSHDLKNMLNALQMSLELTLKVSSQQEAVNLLQKQSIENSLRAAKRMYRLILDLLDFDKSRRSSLDLSLKTEDATGLLYEAFEYSRPLAEQKSINIQMEVPKTKSSLSVICDRGRILQVLSNLVSNAVKFTPSGGKITLGLRSLQDEYIYIVHDTGDGIPSTQIDHVFDRYWQAKDTARQGSGLGLAIAKGIIDAHGGQIGAKSTVGKGSTFFFRLPHDKMAS